MAVALPEAEDFMVVEAMAGEKLKSFQRRDNRRRTVLRQMLNARLSVEVIETGTVRSGQGF